MQAELQVQRALTLPAEPRSAGRARRFLRDVLDDAGRHEWVDAASLAVSELVTNALLHARTPIEVLARVSVSGFRVEVRDFSPRLPSRKAYSDDATTGRGLQLVAAVTDAHGVETLGPDGKVVWFAFWGPEGPRERTAREPFGAAWDHPGPAHRSLGDA